jgi:hypothetical protein
VVTFTPRLLFPQGKSTWCLLNRRLGGLQSWSGRGGEEKNIQPVLGLEPPITQLVAQRHITELSQLLAERLLRYMKFVSKNLLASEEKNIFFGTKKLKLVIETLFINHVTAKVQFTFLE